LYKTQVVAITRSYSRHVLVQGRQRSNEIGNFLRLGQRVGLEVPVGDRASQNPPCRRSWGRWSQQQPPRARDLRCTRRGFWGWGRKAATRTIRRHPRTRGLRTRPPSTGPSIQRSTKACVPTYSLIPLFERTTLRLAKPSSVLSQQRVPRHRPERYGRTTEPYQALHRTTH